MLYSVENASRLTFVSEMQSAKVAADIRKAASDAEASGDLSLVLLVTDCDRLCGVPAAFQAINHCAKRVMVCAYSILSRLLCMLAQHGNPIMLANWTDCPHCCCFLIYWFAV